MILKIIFLKFMTLVLSLNLTFNSVFDRAYKVAYTSKFLHLFQGYRTIIHTDNSSRALAAEEILKHWTSLDHAHPTYIFNHDTQKRTLHRPVGFKMLNVVILRDPLKFSKYLSHRKNVISCDIIIFLIGKVHLKYFSTDYWFLPHLERAGNVFVLSNKKSLKIYKICFYCGIASGRLIKLQKAKSDSINLTLTDLAPPKFKNFFGHELKILYLDFFPFIECTEKVKIKNELVCLKPIGIENKLLKILSRQMNFTYKLVQAVPASYPTLFSLLSSEKYDFAIGGLSITTERLRIVNFSSVIRIQDIICSFVYKMSLWKRIFALAAPFSLTVWILVALSLAFAFTVLCLVKIYIHKEKKFSYSSALLQFLRAVFEQPNNIRNIYRFHIETILIGITWMIFCLFLNACYKSTLASFLIHPPREKLSTLQEVVKQGYKIVLDDFPSNLLSGLLTDEQINSIESENIRTRSNVCDVLNAVKNTTVALISEKTRSDLHFTRDCFLDEEDETSEMADYIPLTKTVHGWPFRNGVPFAESMTKRIERITAAGILNLWRQQILHYNQILSDRTSLSGVSINLKLFASQFLVYLVCILVAILVFVWEITGSYWHKRKQKIYLSYYKN